ncbi:hypothetical protein [Roseibium sp.]|uniref:hypothetical protein n=1 Tax=Roseibium sp. TaxID=1936156 RepID=UPI0039F09CDF
MQVRPISAIHPLRIRQKPIVVPASHPEQPATATSDFPTIPAHIAASAMQRDAYHGAHAEYATQLLADHAAPETYLERDQHLAQYASASARQSDPHTYSISV